MAKCPTQRCRAKDARVFPKTVQTDWFFVHHPSPKTSSLIWVALEGIFFPADVSCCWKGLDPVRCISQVSPGAISFTATRWVSKRRPNIRNVALALPGAPFFFLDWREQHFVPKKTQRFLVTSGGVLFLNQWTQAKDHHCHKIWQK